MSRLVSSGLGALALGAALCCTVAAPAGGLGAFRPQRLRGDPAQSDWPAFRGPKRDNLSPDRGLLTSWPKAGPRLAWKSEGVGEGFSSVSVAGDRVFTMGDKGGSSRVFA